MDFRYLTQWRYEKKMHTHWQFIFTGLTYQPNGKSLSLVFLLIYLITIVRNLGLTALLWNDPTFMCPSTYSLRICLVALLDIIHSDHPALIQLLENLCQEQNDLSNLMQDIIFFLCNRVTTEWFLLATMAYDHYVAIWKPLLFAVNMTNRLCNQLLLLSF